MKKIKTPKIPEIRHDSNGIKGYIFDIPVCNMTIKFLDARSKEVKLGSKKAFKEGIWSHRWLATIAGFVDPMRIRSIRFGPLDYADAGIWKAEVTIYSIKGPKDFPKKWHGFFVKECYIP